MTKQFLLFLVLFLPFIAFAQGLNVTVSGTVTNSTTGAPVANQVVTIMTDSTCGTYYGTATTNANGFYSVIFLTTPVNQCGLYGYTSGCNGAMVYQQSWYGNAQTSATMNFQVACGGTSTGCQAAFTAYQNALGSVTCTNQSTGSSPAASLTYAWSVNGVSSSTVQNPVFSLTAGSYVVCLTIADNTGCTSTYCDSVVVGGGGSNCQAAFTYQVSGNNVYFAGQALNTVGGVAYFWDFGNNTSAYQPNPTATYTQSGTYNVCLTITDTISGCTNTTCQTVTIGTVTPPSTISGFVFLDSAMQGPGGAINLSRVWLIQYDSVAGTLTAIDSQSISISSANGMFAGYNFTGVAQGNYLVKCALISGPDYATNLPTYYAGSLYWSSATYVQPSNNNYNFTMITGTNPGGPGFIGGLVSQGANKINGAAIPNAEVLLLDINDNPIAYQYSDATGNFAFSNLAYGTYKIYTEVMSKTTSPVIVTISPNHASENGVSVEINSTYVGGSITAIENNANIQSVKVYPNPTATNALLSLNLKQNAQVEIALQNVMGQTIFTQTEKMNAGEQAISFSMQNLPKGIYVLKVMVNGAAQEIKVVKE